jgi:hypothetical protein
MNKNILLVEPGYKTKYPPLGLMKLSTYHRKIKGDQVTFVKGCDRRIRDDFWDRIYITSSFTYYWKETVRTINFYRENLFSALRNFYVGGILATIMPNDLFKATGIRPIIGLLNDPQKIEQSDNIIIDNLPPDYEILDQVQNAAIHYNYKDSYLGYTTRGCKRNCDFCAVKDLEPEYIDYIDIHRLINEVKQLYGEKQNLLLMDNNVLFSKEFNRIIQDIKDAGFTKSSVFGKTRRKRSVDFNQGLDARLLNKEKMELLATIPLEPMRIAFDDIHLKNTYIRVVRLAHKYGQKNMSNYILYNHKDSPDDFFERLKINIDLNEEFEKEHEKNNNITKTIIYSFPMRFMPLNSKTREQDTGNKYWNKRYLRGLQVILNVIKGPVMPGRRFFFQAFGKNKHFFKAILLMPDEFIRNRLRVDKDWHQIKNLEEQWAPYVKEWMKNYFALKGKQRAYLIKILGSNDLQEINKVFPKINDSKVKKLVQYHFNAQEIVSEYRHSYGK